MYNIAPLINNNACISDLLRDGSHVNCFYQSRNVLKKNGQDLKWFLKGTSQFPRNPLVHFVGLLKEASTRESPNGWISWLPSMEGAGGLFQPLSCTSSPDAGDSM